MFGGFRKRLGERALETDFERSQMKLRKRLTLLVLPAQEISEQFFAIVAIICGPARGHKLLEISHQVFTAFHCPIWYLSCAHRILALHDGCFSIDPLLGWRKSRHTGNSGAQIDLGPFWMQMLRAAQLGKMLEKVLGEF